MDTQKMKTVENKRLASVIWNSIGSGLSAGQAAIILIFVSRVYNANMAGVITIAYAISNLFFSIGKYGVRNFQATDCGGAIRFEDYLKARIISVSIALFAACIFLIIFFIDGRYNQEKCEIIFLIVFLKQIDAFEDVFLGRLQQIDCFDIGAKIMAFKQIAVTFLICIEVACKNIIQISLLAGIAASLLIDFFMLFKNKELIKDGIEAGTETKSLNYLMKQCFPLCLGTTLAMYVGNAPKYIIDIHMDEYTQAVLGYIMLPVFMVTLLNQFIYLPFVKELGDLWNNKCVRQFKTKVRKQVLFIVIIAIMVLLGSVWIGLPLLSAVYNINLSGYYLEFVVILIGGSLYALAFYLNIPITIFRKQNLIAIGYGGAAIASFVFGGLLCRLGGMLGAALLYTAINGGLVLIFGMLLRKEVDKAL